MDPFVIYVSCPVDVDLLFVHCDVHFFVRSCVSCGAKFFN